MLALRSSRLLEGVVTFEGVEGGDPRYRLVSHGHYEPS